MKTLPPVALSTLTDPAGASPMGQDERIKRLACVAEMAHRQLERDWGAHQGPLASIAKRTMLHVIASVENLCRCMRSENKRLIEYNRLHLETLKEECKRLQHVVWCQRQGRWQEIEDVVEQIRLDIGNAASNIEGEAEFRPPPGMEEALAKLKAMVESEEEGEGGQSNQGRRDPSLS